MDVAKFYTIEEDELDLVLSFALNDNDCGVKSLILYRAPGFERLLPDTNKGVHVSMEGEHEDDNEFLTTFQLNDESIRIETTTHHYHVDVSCIDKPGRHNIEEFIQKLNFDQRFRVNIT